MIKKNLTINGVARMVVAPPDAMLANVIREQLGLTGTKIGCGQAQCGACNVILNNKLIKSCITKMSRVPNESTVITVEGVGNPDNLHPLQLAWAVHGGAQCGFCTPGFIVSSKALLDSNANPTREDVREWFQKNKNACRCTGYKQLVDAVMDAAKVLRGEMKADELFFKIPVDGEIWGGNMPRPTAIAKVTGTLDYGADLGAKMPAGTLQLALVQAEVSHANIKGIDTSEAEKMPGVEKIVTCKDIKGKNRITGLITFPTNKGDGWDRPILCDEKVFQYGDAIAIVCADTIENAKAAAAKVKVDMEVLPAYMGAPAAMADDAMEIHPGTPNVYFTQNIKKGADTKPIFDSAAVVVEDDFFVGRQPHMPIEPDVGLAYMDDGKLIIQSKSIALNLHRMMIAPGLGIELDDLVMIQNPTGGTFGYKFSPTMEALVGAACMATGKPVYLCYDYHQQQTYTGKRSPFHVHMRLAADKDGKLLGMETDFNVDHGPYSEFGDLLTTRGFQFMGAGYDIKNIRGIGRTVCTNHSWGSAFRAYGSPQSFYPTEVLMDRIAAKLGMDPLELRYKNVYRDGSTTPTGQTPEVLSLPEILETLRPKYKAAMDKAKANSTATVKRGVGVSVGIYGCGLDGPDTSGAKIELNPDNSVTVYNTWEDHGQGADIGTLTTAHKALRPLGLSPDQIHLNLNDTSLAPDSGPSGGSRQQVVTGRAIKATAEIMIEARKKADGTFMTYDEMKEAGKPLAYEGKWSAPATLLDENSQGSPFSVYMYGVFMAEVAVDTTTGVTTVEKISQVADIGKVCNMLCTDGQIYGGMAQGIGLALTEDFEDIKKHSTLVGAGFPYCKQIPDDMEIIYVQTPRPEGPFGAAGVGELPLTSPHAAIMNAMTNACGVCVTKLPALPEKVLAALKG
jgi:aldehyde oxidoreductase